MNIYLACGLTHVPRSIFDQYVSFIHALAKAIAATPDVGSVKYALVDSDPQLADKPWVDQATLCYTWDRQMVESADLVVAEASFPSTGLGIEMQIAEASGKPIILLVGDYGVNRVVSAKYENPDHTAHELQIGKGIVSLMALGVPSITRVLDYDDPNAAILATVDAVSLFSRA